MHEHNECEHNLKYCEKCKVVYCTKCKQEWEEHCCKNHYQSYYYGSSTIPCITTWNGTAASDVTYANTICTH